ncbi:MAG: PASTA domain-containing protein, partial [Rhodococcus sp.]|nr:PASTA domain-containing protein [Rhodococcus sp. (in: high G+C Gram-positive bacteria)]
PFSLGGHGAGSIFKVFTTAAAMEQGLGTSAVLPVPPTYQARGMGSGGARGCPADAYCVGNAGAYPGALSVADALAQSPNTTFVKLIAETGVGPTVDMAVRLGMRSYTKPNTSGFDERSLADFQKDQNLGSFTLGPTWINPLELANVGATLASSGKWCPPSPIDTITDRDGKPVSLTEQACEQVVDPGLANSLSVAMSKDDLPGGTAFSAANTVSWTRPMSGKTGTTESHFSSGFLGFTNTIAGAAYAFGDSPNPGEICSFPLRRCGSGNLFGGNEPARTWFQAIDPVVDRFGPVHLPPTDEKYVRGSQNGQVPDVVGMPEAQARGELERAGFSVSVSSSNSDAPVGTVVSQAPAGSAVPGSSVTLYISDGTEEPGDGGDRPPAGGLPPIHIPGLPPIQIPMPR